MRSFLSSEAPDIAAAATLLILLACIAVIA